jgi:DNA-binding transcriptional ArsR family regulator
MANPNISIPASLIGEPTRAAILMALMDGRSHAAGALSTALNISPQSASNHLGQLADGGLLTAVQQGRHRYYRLASSHVAYTLEALTIIAAPVRLAALVSSRASEPLLSARCCYSHLAGALGVQLLEALLLKQYLVAIEETSNGRTKYRLSPSGEAWANRVNLPHKVEAGQRGWQHALSCLDWTERRNHLAGPLGKQLLSYFLANGLLVRGNLPRSLKLSTRGIVFFQTELDLILGQTLLRRA